MRTGKTGLLFFILCFLLHITTDAQDSSYVRWTSTSKRISDGLYELRLKATIDKGWYLYTKDNQIEGVTGLKISFTNSSIQKQEKPQLTGTVKTITDKIFDNKQADVAEGDIEVVQKIKINEAIPSILELSLSYNLENTGTAKFENAGELKFIPEEQKITVTLEGGVEIVPSNRILISTIDLKNPVNSCGGVNETSGSLWQLFFWGILGGLVSLFTPCVFPMIPLTVSFFTKKSGDRKKGIGNAVLYGFFIFLIYVLLSVPFYFIEKGNPEILNNISTNAWLNIFFFAIFIFFALSFFGYYEITLPDKFTNKADSRAGLGNIVGIFFMALTLAIVSFSCTGPLLGTLVVSSLNQNGGAMQLTAAMAGFGVAFGLPFTLFAMFPNLLDKLPKSGGWLNSFKVVLGFFELALALKFLSNADLVKHWGLLKREIFIGIWVIVGILLTIYLLGKIKFPHDSPIKKLSKLRIFFAILTGAFTIYLIPGLSKEHENLSLISGFPPPLYYSIYQKQSDCVLDLNCSHDYEEGLKMAKKENKPILLDFTGYACVNCRRMEENVWSKPDVWKIMKDKFIVISLYVDDKKTLPTASQFTYKTLDSVEKDINTVGDKWATFETENFKKNAQPLYAIISNDEMLLTNPVGYTPDVNEYKQWLECGLSASKK
jgi:thiol:disulfide interchange protein